MLPDILEHDELPWPIGEEGIHVKFIQQVIAVPLTGIWTAADEEMYRRHLRTVDFAILKRVVEFPKNWDVGSDY